MAGLDDILVKPGSLRRLREGLVKVVGWGEGDAWPDALDFMDMAEPAAVADLEYRLVDGRATSYLARPMTLPWSSTEREPKLKG